MPRYYETLNRGCDSLLRCKDCHTLVPLATIHRQGSCVCGNRRFAEILTLSPWEWCRIRLGLIRFPGRALFLHEFPFREMIW